MSDLRRAYLYLACAVSLQATTWGLIALLQNLLAPDGDINREAIAFQASLIVVALPIFALHWRWAQREARETAEARGSALRRLYLYGMLTLFLVPLLASVFNMVALPLMRFVVGPDLDEKMVSGWGPTVDPTADFVSALAGVVVLGAMAAYHWRVTGRDSAAVPETGRSATIRRLFVLGFSAAGAVLSTIAAIHLLRLTLLGVTGSDAIAVGGGMAAAREAARLIVGMPVWLIFWTWAQRLHADGPAAERESALRWLYLYAAVFIGVLGVIAPIGLIIAGALRLALGLAPSGEISDALAIIPVAAVLWAYHARVLRTDAAVGEEVPRQARVRRIYVYLLAAVGLLTLLVGLVTLVQVVVRGLTGTGVGDIERAMLSQAAAAVLVGTPLWAIAWSRAQAAAHDPGEGGAAERGSTTRTLYLYFFLFIATITVLAGTVYLVYRLLSALFGLTLPPDTDTRVAEATAYAVLGAIGWLYHGSILRGDLRQASDARDERLAAMRTAVVDGGDGSLGRALVDAISRDLPALPVTPISLTDRAAATMGGEVPGPALGPRLADVDVVIAPWDAAVGVATDDPRARDWSEALRTAPARKLILPRPAAGWDQAGVEPRDVDDLVGQTLHAIRQMADGEPVTPDRPMTVGLAVGLIAAAILLLILVVIPIVGLVVGGSLDSLFG